MRNAECRMKPKGQSRKMIWPAGRSDFPASAAGFDISTSDCSLPPPLPLHGGREGPLFFPLLFLDVIVQAAHETLSLFVGRVGGKGKPAAAILGRDDISRQPAGLGAKLAEDGQTPAPARGRGSFERPGTAPVQLNLDREQTAVLLDETCRQDIALVQDRFAIDVQLDRGGAEDGDGRGPIVAAAIRLEVNAQGAHLLTALAFLAGAATRREGQD